MSRNPLPYVIYLCYISGTKHRRDYHFTMTSRSHIGGMSWHHADTVESYKIPIVQRWRFHCVKDNQYILLSCWYIKSIAVIYLFKFHNTPYETGFDPCRIWAQPKPGLDTRNWASSRILSPMFYPASQARTGNSILRLLDSIWKGKRETHRNTTRQWRQDTRAEIPTNTKNIWHPWVQ